MKTAERAAILAPLLHRYYLDDPFCKVNWS